MVRGIISPHPLPSIPGPLPPGRFTLLGAHAILCTVSDRPGMLSDLTEILADEQAHITNGDITTGPSLGG